MALSYAFLVVERWDMVASTKIFETSQRTQRSTINYSQKIEGEGPFNALIILDIAYCCNNGSPGL